MAERKAADDEFNPRHRIVGAVILVALAVIFLPMFLSERPPEPRTTMPGAMPTPESRVAVAPVMPSPDSPVKPGGEPSVSGVRTVTVPVGPASTRSPAVPVPPDSSPEPAKKTAPVSESTHSPDTKPASEPKPAKTATASPKPAANTKGKWIVQVGVFSHAENARRLQNQLKQKGYSVLLDPPKAPAGSTIRVEVGPYRDEAAARKAAARLQAELGIKGIVRTD